MEKTNKIIAYYRVSTKRQGLGLDAQRNTVLEYAAANNLVVVDEVSEKESGKEDDRPGLNLAIAKAKKERAALVVAKVDRISRDISYAAKVFFKSGLSVVALNLPAYATDPLLFSVYFGLAQQEAKMISERTKAALAAKKEAYRKNVIAILKDKGYREEDITPELFEATARATNNKLGRPGWEIEPQVVKNAAAARKTQADTNPANVAAAQELRRYFESNKRNLSAAARHLNEMQLYTSRGVFHTAMSVKLLIKRFDL